MEKEKREAWIDVKAPCWPLSGVVGKGFQLAFELFWTSDEDGEFWRPVAIHLVTKTKVRMKGQDMVMVFTDSALAAKPARSTARGQGRGRARGRGRQASVEAPVMGFRNWLSGVCRAPLYPRCVHDGSGRGGQGQ